MKVRYTIDALLHIAAIHAYINERNPVAATRVVARIRSAAEHLGDTPEIGHTGAANGTREWVVRGLPYVVVHEVNRSEDEVVGSWRVSRRSAPPRPGFVRCST